MDSCSRLEVARLADPAATDADHVRRIAAGVLDELDIVEPPVDMEMVASWLGISRVIIDPALPISGCLLHVSGRFEIRVRGDEPLGRQRFTIGHECSHTFFPAYALRTQFRCSPTDLPDDESDVETLCDLGATELVMPTRLFAPHACGATFELADLEALARLYKTSLEATGRRFVTVRPEPAVLLVLSVRQKPSETGTHAPPKLRLDHATVCGDWPYFLHHKSATHRDVFDRALYEEVVSERTTITGICASPVRVEVHAKLCPVTINGARRDRVIAIARRVRADR